MIQTSELSVFDNNPLEQFRVKALEVLSIQVHGSPDNGSVIELEGLCTPCFGDQYIFYLPVHRDSTRQKRVRTEGRNIPPCL